MSPIKDKTKIKIAKFKIKNDLKIIQKDVQQINLYNSNIIKNLQDL